MQQLVVHSDVQTSCITVEVIQRLEHETEATTMSMAVMAEIKMRDTIEGMRHDFQAELEQIWQSHVAVRSKHENQWWMLHLSWSG